MSWWVEMEGEDRVEESETMLRVLWSWSGWPRSARQLGQRNPNDNTAGDLYTIYLGLYKGEEFRAGRRMSHRLTIECESKEWGWQRYESAHEWGWISEGKIKRWMSNEWMGLIIGHERILGIVSHHHYNTWQRRHMSLETGWGMWVGWVMAEWAGSNMSRHDWVIG